MGVLIIGVGMAQLLTLSSVAATDLIPTEVLGATLDAPEIGPPEIGSAELDSPEIESSDPLVPTPTEHLSVVQVSVSVCGFRSSGSGVVVSDGLVLTAAHVVGDASLVRVDYRGVTITGEVLGVLGDGRDVALIAVDAPLATPVVGAAAPPLGAPLTLVGYPGAGPLTSSAGPVVDIAPVVATLAGAGEIVGIDVATAVGISGGPAVDADGAVVGLVIAIETETDTALVVTLPDLTEIESAALVPGHCPATA